MILPPCLHAPVSRPQVRVRRRLRATRASTGAPPGQRRTPCPCVRGRARGCKQTRQDRLHRKLGKVEVRGVKVLKPTLGCHARRQTCRVAVRDQDARYGGAKVLERVADLRPAVRCGGVVGAWRGGATRAGEEGWEASPRMPQQSRRGVRCQRWVGRALPRYRQRR